MLVLIDNGHGVDTKGKRSFDETFFEWEYTRRVAREVVKRLSDGGINAQLLTPEDKDITITERVKRVNQHVDTLGKDEVVVISIHNDAFGTDWNTANGWSVFVYNSASENSKELADYLHDAAKEQGLKIRYYKPTQNYWQAGYGILRSTKCPAALTENLFYTNKKDKEFLESEEGFEKIVTLHVEGIAAYVNAKCQCQCQCNCHK